MLTPRDIETREFSRSRAGYKTDEVEAFLDEILADYSKILEERDSYAKRVLSLSEKLESIREEQQNELKKMLEANFKTRDDIISEAKSQAMKIVNAAKSEKETALLKIQSELEQAKAELETVKLSKNVLIKEVDDFKAELRNAYEAHIKLINTLPSLTKEQLDEKAATEPHDTETDTDNKDLSVSEVPEQQTIEDTFQIEPEDDFSSTIIMKPAKEKDTTLINENNSIDEDEEIILPKSASSHEKSKASYIRADENKIKELFDSDKTNKTKDKKPFKKTSRFFKQDEDDFFDDDFDDE